MSDLDLFCKETVESVFPDVEALREKCVSAGRIPVNYRGHAWSLFVVGTLVNDEEVCNESAQLDRIMDIYSFSESWNISNLEKDLQDLISLYCRRTNLEYQDYMLQILVPLMISSSPMPKALMSSCFYNLCTSFLPLHGYHLKPSPGRHELDIERNSFVVDKQSSLLRLLIGYHFPKLLLHLDSIFPEWEKTFDINDVATDDRKGGMIPVPWMSALFAGTLLRPDKLLVLWDWCILLGQRNILCTEIFLISALFGLCEDTLSRLQSPEELKEWTRIMCRGGYDAFRQISLCQSHMCNITATDKGTSSNSSIKADNASGEVSRGIVEDDVNTAELEYDNEEDEFDDDDDDDFALGGLGGGGGRGRDFDDFKGGASGGMPALSLVQLKETSSATTAGSILGDEKGRNAKGKHKPVSVSAFYMGAGMDDYEEGNMTGEDSFFSDGPDPATPVKASNAPEALSSGRVAGIVERESAVGGNGFCDDGRGNLEVNDSDSDLDRSLHPKDVDSAKAIAVTHKIIDIKSQAYYGSYTPLLSNDEVDAEAAFFWGWLNCTARLFHTTPVSFRSAIDHIEDWAVAAAKEKLTKEALLQEDGRGGLEAESGEDELDRSNHNWGEVSTDGSRRGRSSRDDLCGGDGDGEGANIDGDEESYDVTDSADLMLSYHEESSKRLSRGGKDDRADDLLGEFDSPVTTRKKPSAGWGQGFGAGISALAHMASTSIHLPKGNQHPQNASRQLERKSHSVASKFPLLSKHDRACVFTTAEEVLPCVCSTRRRSEVNSNVAFEEAFTTYAYPSTEEARSFPCPMSSRLTESELPFFFSIDCWPDDSSSFGVGNGSNRLCRIPKALQMSYAAVTDAMAMEDMLQVLQPLSHTVHIVLIGKGHEVIRYQNRLKNGGVDMFGLESGVAIEDAQLGALAMSLMKHGFSHVSVLEGGMGAVLQYLSKCDGKSGGDTENESDGPDKFTSSGLGLHVLVDVDQDEIDGLFASISDLHHSVDNPPTSTMMEATKVTTAAVSGMLSSSMSTITSSTFNLFAKKR